LNGGDPRPVGGQKGVDPHFWQYFGQPAPVLHRLRRFPEVVVEEQDPTGTQGAPKETRHSQNVRGLFPGVEVDEIVKYRRRAVGIAFPATGVDIDALFQGVVLDNGELRSKDGVGLETSDVVPAEVQ